MSRTEYMRELDALLQGISKEEREEALQYYNDYFDDAGSENEEKVIEELGSPVKLANTIRAGVNGSTDEAENYGEYGERGYRDSRFDTSESPARRTGYSYAGVNGYRAEQTAGKPQKKSSVGKIILIICICIIGIPIIVPTALGLLLTAFGVLIALAVAVFAVFIAAIAVAIAGILIGVCGFGQLFYSPVLGIGMLGAGCLMLAIGVAVTVLIGWGCIKLFPIVFRGFVNLCRKPFQKKRGECR